MKNRDRMNILININKVIYFHYIYIKLFFFFYYTPTLPLPHYSLLTNIQLKNARNNAAKQEPQFTNGKHESSKNLF